MQGQAKKVVLICLVSITIFFGACRQISNDGNGDNVPLEIFSISPTTALSHLPFLLKAVGRGISGNSVIVFNGSEVDTVYLAPGELSAEISADMVAFQVDQPTVDVPVWVITKDPSTGEILEKSSHFFLSVRSMPEFSEPRSIYQIRAEKDNIFDCKLMPDTDGHFYVAWKEVAWWLDGSEVTKLGISTDGGQSWDDPKEIPSHQSIFVRNGKLFAFPNENDITADGQLKYYYSSDNGTSWETRLIRHVEQDNEFRGYLVSMDADGRFTLVFGQVDQDNIVKLTTLHSSDSGQTWEVKGESVTPVDIGIDRLYGYRLQWLVANTGGGVSLGCTYDSIIPNAISRVYMSTDGGCSFVEFPEGLSERNILYFYGGFLTEQGTLYAVYCDNEYYRIYNSAFFQGNYYGSQTGNFHVFADAPGKGCMAVNDEEHIYAQFGAYIMRSVDKGEAWAEPADLSAYVDGSWLEYQSMAIDSNQRVYIVGDNGKDILLVNSKQPENIE